MTTPRHSRRRFLHHSLAACGVASSALSRAGTVAANEVDTKEPLRGAVIGCGGIASHHARVNLAPHFKITAICDVDRQRSDAYKSLVPEATTVCVDYRELLDRDDIDVFFVCAPDHWHTKITVDALRSGKDVYCEKPLTFSVDEGRLIEKVVRETGGVLQVGTQQRSDPSFQTAVALARSGRLGAIKRITAAIGGGPTGGPFKSTPPPESLDWNQWLGQAPEVDYIPQRCHGNFRWWYEYSGGKLTDWGAHHVDIAMWALGGGGDQPIAIEVLDAAHPVELVDGMPALDNQYNTANSFRIRCRFPGGTELIICDHAKQLGFDNGILFECEQGRFFVNRGKLTGKPIEDLSSHPLDKFLFDSLRKGRPVMPHMENFYRSCRERGAGISDPASHIRHLNVCHLANIAMRLGRNLRWDPASQTVMDDQAANEWLVREQRNGFEVS
ncbi:Gfo/Idh/MocA family protein [Rhodopirellula sp. JC639]|uniref:Gfo/Idh/MocA family protein n=1 Tax=Stieleria mannarensis TaxID=2755585 RepID=UPI001601E8C9|nr:Gfo/Idh/MocA family oxidoreductase [Rhodopirellula sp. JC639]